MTAQQELKQDSRYFLRIYRYVPLILLEQSSAINTGLYLKNVDNGFSYDGLYEYNSLEKFIPEKYLFAFLMKNIHNEHIFFEIKQDEFEQLINSNIFSNPKNCNIFINDNKIKFHSINIGKEYEIIGLHE